MDRFRCCCPVALLTVLLLAACARGGAGVTDATPSTSSLDGDAAGSPQADADAALDESRHRLSRFESCRVEIEGGGELQTFEILLSAEGHRELMSPAEFEARSARAALDKASELASQLPEVKAIGPMSTTVVCREIAAPDGDVDYELEIVWGEHGPEVAMVDIAHQNLAMPTANRPQSCQRTVMGDTFCASAPDGVAVVSGMGRVVCARGQCTRGQPNNPDSWQCARAAGGWVETTTRGVRCEGGCYSPTTTQCRRM